MAQVVADRGKDSDDGVARRSRYEAAIAVVFGLHVVDDGIDRSAAENFKLDDNKDAALLPRNESAVQVLRLATVIAPADIDALDGPADQAIRALDGGALHDVRANLLAGVDGLFATRPMPREEMTNAAEAEHMAVLGRQSAYFFDGDFGRLAEQRQDKYLAGLSLFGAPAGVQCLWTRGVSFCQRFGARRCKLDRGFDEDCAPCLL